jgi:glucose-6-phosphate isomerase
MASPLRSGTDCPVWPELESLAQKFAATPTRELFARDPQRFQHCSAEAAGLVYDYSRQRVDSTVVNGLVTLADQLALRGRIEAMFRGDAINSTENRAVLHTALRRSSSAPLMVGSDDVSQLVRNERTRMLGFAEDVRTGIVRSSTDQSFELVVNIGIGGSDLGPAMAVEALKQFTQGAPRVAFVSNVDGCQLADIIETADPARTLFIICSKTFTTLETQTNAKVAREWILKRLGGKGLPQHFAAVSVNARAMDEFGVHPDY